MGGTGAVLPRDGTVTVGRHLSNTVVCRSRSVSRRHCIVHCSAPKPPEVEPLNPNNVTYIGSHQLRMGTRFQISEGDVLSFPAWPGDPKVEYQFTAKPHGAKLVRVSTLSGMLCTVDAITLVSVLDVMKAIENVSGIPCLEQRLVAGSRELRRSEPLGQIFETLTLRDDALEIVLLRRSPEQAEWLAKVESDGNTLSDAPPHIQEDESVVMAALSENCEAFKYAAEALRGKREFVLKVIRAEPSKVLRYATKELRRSPDFLLDVLFYRPSAFRYIPQPYKDDRNFVLEAVRRNGAILGEVKAFSGDHEVVLAAVRADGSNLRFASDAARADSEIVLAAVRTDGCSLKFASDELRGNREHVFTAARQKKAALKYASPALRSELLAHTGSGHDFIQGQRSRSRSPRR